MFIDEYAHSDYTCILRIFSGIIKDLRKTFPSDNDAIYVNPGTMATKSLTNFLLQKRQRRITEKQEPKFRPVY